MPMTATCANCLADKSNLHDYYCEDCNAVVLAVEKKADATKADMQTYRSEKEMALAGRRHSSMSQKHRPDTPFARIDDTDMRNRLGLNQ